MMKAVLWAAFVLSAAAASATPLDAFTAGFGEDGVTALADRGYILLQGRGYDRRVAAAHWKALEALAAAAPSCRILVEDFGAPPPPAADLGIAACRSLPADGAVTPRVQEAAAAMEAEAQEGWALSVSSAGLEEPLGLPNLYDTPWGRALSARRRADRLDETAFLAKDFFHEFLAGVHPNPEAIKHFVAVETARGVSGVDAKLSADAARGALSDETRGMIARYLLDERRRHGLYQARERLKTLDADKAVRRDIELLSAIVSGLTMRPNLLTLVESAVSAAASPSGLPRLRSAGLHLQEPTRLGQYELGDEARVSGAYWVDGLPEEASVEIAETTVVETSRGFAAAQTQTVKRRNGGPYPFERRVTITETKPFALVALISASSGTLIAERAEVRVAPDFELALKKEADALQSRMTCDPQGAQAAYEALEGLVADAAKVKPQYKALLERTRDGRRKATEDAALLASLNAATTTARSEASGAQCRFDPAAADAAIKIARRLPPGCDKVLPELFASRLTLTRRAADQAWFLKTSAAARAKRRSCDFSAAARTWSDALSVLEADPAARCGKVAEEAKAAESELAAAQLALSWNDSIAKTFDKADSETVPAKRLELVRPALARIAALDDGDCRRDATKRGERLAQKAGEDEGGPSAPDAAMRLPPDSTLNGVVDDVRRARAHLLGKADAASAPPVIAPAVPIKKARKKIKVVPAPEPVTEPLP
jgi:hypothetical protein